MPFSVYLHFDLLEAVPKRGDQRRLVMDFMRSLAEFLHTPGDFSDRDESLRTRQIKIVGRYTVTYWADDAVKAAWSSQLSPLTHKGGDARLG
jgi:hypothetical protein